MNKLFLSFALLSTVLISCTDVKEESLSTETVIFIDTLTPPDHSASGKNPSVRIPDPILRKYLKAEYPDCFDENGFLDTACQNQSTGRQYIMIRNTALKSLEGIQYFKNLTFVLCENNQINYVPKVPSKVKRLLLGNNQVTDLPSLPDSLNELDITNNKFESMPKLPKALTVLYCSDNHLTVLPVLPANLKYIDAYGNCFKKNPVKPKSVEHFDVSPNSEKCK